MRNLNIKSAVVLFFFFMAAGFCFLTCDSKPTEPIPEEELTDYRVWFVNLGDVGYITLYAYHPTTHAIDTFDVEWNGRWRTKISADGRLLYLSGDSPDVTQVLETDSLHLVTELPYGYISAVSPDGRYILANQHVLRTSDYSVVYYDSLIIGHVWFTTNGDTLYAVSDHVLKVTFTNDTGEIVERRPLDNWTGGVQIVPTPDGSKWLIYAGLPPLYTWIFKVYDVALDSIIFSEVQRPGAGRIAMTPDGRYAFYGNPGTLQCGPPPDTSFKVYDIEANAIDRVVPIQRVINGVEAPWPYIIGEIVVTPDNRWLVMLSALPGLHLILYDLKKKEWVDL